MFSPNKQKTNQACVSELSDGQPRKKRKINKTEQIIFFMSWFENNVISP